MARDLSLKLINEEYADLSEKMIKKLGRKRDITFARGKSEIWATAVVHAIGNINFLYDKTFLPFSSLDKICAHFNTNKSTVGSKAGEIRKLLNLAPFDSEFSTKHLLENNPFDELEMTQDGFIIPKNSQPGLFDELEEDEFEEYYSEEDISEFEDYLFSKIAIFVKPRKPFYEWINKMEATKEDSLKPDNYMDGFTYLVNNDTYLLNPAINKDKILKENYTKILHDLFLISGREPELLPQNFSFEKFKSWCECFVSLSIIDLDYED